MLLHFVALSKCVHFVVVGPLHMYVCLSSSFVHNHYNMCVVSWSLLYMYEPFHCLINHTCSVARKLTVLSVSTKWQLKITKPY